MISAARLRQYEQALRDNRQAFRLALVSAEAEAKTWGSEKRTEVERDAVDEIFLAHQGRLNGAISINDCEERCRQAIVRAENAR